MQFQRMEKDSIEFCDLSTHYFISDGIQVTLRYPANCCPPSDALRIMLCSESEHERLVRHSETRQRDGDWVHVTLDIPASQLEGLGSGEYWLRCERHRDGEAVIASRCESFSLCLEPRDIPAHRITNDLNPAERDHPSPPSLSGSFVLVEEEEEEENERDDTIEESMEGERGNTRRASSPCVEREYRQKDELSPMARPHKRDLSPFDHSSTRVERLVATCGTQSDLALSAVAMKTAVEERGTQTQSSADLCVQQIADMSASGTYVTTLSEAEVSVLKSNNRDLMVKLRRLVEKNCALEQEKETEARVRRESNEQLATRLTEVEGELQLLRAQLLQNDAARAALVSERDGVVAEKVSLATERDALCAELLHLRDECAAQGVDRDALRAELQSITVELECAKKKVKEQEDTISIFNNELKSVFERCTQLEGKLVSKENELRVANERAAEWKREMKKVLDETARLNAPGSVGNSEDSITIGKGEMARREKHIDTRERSADRLSDDKKREISSSGSSNAAFHRGSEKLHGPKQWDKSIESKTFGLLPCLPPNPSHFLPRAKDEFVTGVGPNGKIASRKSNRPHRQHHHSSPSQLPHDSKSTSTQTLVPGEVGAVGSVVAAPPITGGGLWKSGSGDVRIKVIQCPICKMDLHSRDTEYSATLHVEHCLLKQGQRDEGGGMVAPTEGRSDNLFNT